MSKIKNKLFIIRKYVKAKNVGEAFRKEKKQGVDDCWVDEDWKKSQKKEYNKLEDAIGFDVDNDEE